MTATHDLWTDADLRELARTEPELIAVAEALSEAGSSAAGGRRRFAPPPRLVTAAAAVAVAVVVALVAPWERFGGGGSLTDMALASIGSEPVLHVVVKLPSNAELVDLATGDGRAVYQDNEFWYDGERGLKRSLVRVGDTIVDDTLETPKGGYTRDGIVYDCAWIAAHPAAATKAQTSCDPSGINGAIPRSVPRPKPGIEPGLSGFVDNYRRVLATGQAREGGKGEIDGQDVDWLVLSSTEGTERVALDRATHRPLLLEDNQGRSVRITTIETIPFNPADFARPVEATAQPSSSRVSDALALRPGADAITSAMPKAVWATASVDGVSLVLAQQQALTAKFANDSQPTRTGEGIELGYGTLRSSGHLDWSEPYVQINEAPNRVLAHANAWAFIRGDDPPAGHLYAVDLASSDEHLGFLITNGTYVTIRASTQKLLLQAARLLTPAAP